MDNTYKMKLIESGLFTKTYSSNSEYRGRCPFCGHKGNKFYIKIDLTSDDPVKYNCFHCPASGYLNHKLLERLGLDNIITLPKGIKEMKRLSVDTVVDCISIDTVNENDFKYIDYAKEYIMKSYGVEPSIDDLKRFQFIGNPSVYCSDYLGNDDIDSLRDKRLWFKMTNGNIMGKNINTGDWRKYHSSRVHDGIIHQMKTMIDTYEDINVIIANDIFDSIGLYYSNINIDNCMYISVCGKQYIRGIRHMLNKGIFGKSVHIHMMVDETTMNKTFIDKNTRSLFGKCFIYENSNGNGYVSSNINLHRIEKR
jgi:hypothetical protein